MMIKRPLYPWTNLSYASSSSLPRSLPFHRGMSSSHGRPAPCPVPRALPPPETGRHRRTAPGARRRRTTQRRGRRATCRGRAQAGARAPDGGQQRAVEVAEHERQDVRREVLDGRRRLRPCGGGGRRPETTAHAADGHGQDLHRASCCGRKSMELYSRLIPGAVACVVDAV